MIATGRPTSIHREQQKVRSLTFAAEYVDMKWAHLAPDSRRNTARVLTNATLAMIVWNRGRPAHSDLKRALAAWTFNGSARRAEARRSS